MIGFGGPPAMLLLVGLAAVVCAIGVALLGRRVGWGRAVPLGLLIWSLICLCIVTLTPASMAAPAVRYTEMCSFDYDGPAPDGFWILPGGQRFLNTVAFVPSGILLTWTLSRFRRGLWWLLPGLIGLAGWSVVIELTQQRVSRLGRACDITDIVDNTIGAITGVAIGLVAVGLWWLVTRLRRSRSDRHRHSR